MLKEFITQNYLIIESNVVTNICVWDGDTTIWTPPTGSIALIQATTPSKIWQYDKVTNTFILTEQLGFGSIGFTWDGSFCITNEPQPKPPEPQPVTEGTIKA
jgi:hypothetical protein